MAGNITKDVKATTHLGRVGRQTATTSVLSSGIDIVTQDQGNPEHADEYARLGRLQVRARNWPQAIEFYEKSLQLHSAQPSVYRELAQALTQVKQMEQATTAWFRAFQLEPDWATAEQHYNLANNLVKQGKFEEGMVCYKQAIRLKPEMVATHESLSQLTEPQKNPDGAAVPHRPTFDIDKVATEREMAANTTVSRSAKATTAPARRRPAVEAMRWHQQGEQLQEQENWERSARAYQQAIDLNPNFSWSHHNLGDVLRKVKEWQDAADSYRRAIALNPNFLWSYLSLGESLSNQQRWNEAVHVYRQALELEPDSPEVMGRLADTLRQSAQSSMHEASALYLKRVEAEGADEVDYRKALELNPSDIRLYQKLATLLVEEGRLDEAIFVYQTARQIVPQNLEVLEALGQILSRVGKESEALECIQQAVALSPDSFAIQFALGDLLSKQDRLDEALIAFQRCVELDSDSHWAHQCLGNVYLWLSQPVKAIAAYQQVVKLEPQLAEAHKQMGNAFTQLGQVDEASLAYGIALQLDAQVI